MQRNLYYLTFGHSGYFKEIKRSKDMLSNERFLSKAPEAKILEEKLKYENYLSQYEKVMDELKEYV